MGIKNNPKAPKAVGVTWKNYNVLIKELPHIEDEKKEMNERMKSFKGLQKWDIPTILTNDK